MRKKTALLLLLPLCLALPSCGGRPSISSSSEASSSEPSSSSESSSSQSPSSSSESSSASSESSSPARHDDMDKISGFQTAAFYYPRQEADEAGGYDYVLGFGSHASYAITKKYGRQEAFLSVDSAFGFACFAEAIAERDLSKEVNEASITYTIEVERYGDIVITIDAENDQVTFSDFDSYSFIFLPYRGDIGTTNEAKAAKMVDEGYSYVTGGPLTFDLAEYGIDILQVGETAYIPSAACSYLFLHPLMLPTAWNGSDFYYFSSPTSALYNSTFTDYSAFGKSYYGGPLNGVTPSQDVATLHGNESMFYLDHFYGFQDDSSFPGGKFSAYLKANHQTYYDLFFSTGIEDSQKAWDYVLRTVIGDGHTDSVASAGSFYMGGALREQADYNERRTTLVNTYQALAIARARAFNLYDESGEELGYITKERMFEVYEDMAIIRFDSFRFGIDSPIDASKGKDYYYQYMESDLYCLFAYSFLSIAEDPSIKKVLIDLTCNQGGAVAACFEALGFLKDTFNVTLHDPLTKSLSHLCYEGVMPGGKTDSYADDGYEFYLLTSSFSFSCGNIFPTVFKNNAMGTILGQTSGGGACIVQHGKTPDGQSFQISGIKRVSRTDGVESNDAGIAPDVQLDPSSFYDLTKLYAAVNNASTAQ